MIKSNVVYLISRIHEKAVRLIEREIVKHGMEGLAASHGDIIASLYKKKEMPMKELAVLIGRDKSTVTSLVSKLIDLGYVKKKIDVNDGRISYIELTGKALERKHDFDDISSILILKVFKNLSSEEISSLEKILDKINSDW